MIITIIVLLILSGVALNLVVGEEGIVGKVDSSKERYEISRDKEMINLALSTAQMTPNYKNYNAQDIEEALAGQDVQNVTQRGNNISLTLNGRNYRIKPNGEIIEYTYIDTPTGVCWKMDSNGTLRIKANDSTYTSGTGWTRASVKKVIIEEPIAPISTFRWFMNCTNLTEIQGMNNLHTENVTNMQQMFYKCTSLKSLDVSYFDTIKVTNMVALFYGCKDLTSLDISSFNTSRVTTMQNMFLGCSGLKSLNLIYFNTSSVNTLSEMFRECSGLKSLDLSGFNTSQVTNMSYMFLGCRGLKSLNISNFNTNQVINMTGMFWSCSGLKSLDLSKFDTSLVINMNEMFRNCSKLAPILVGTGWKDENATKENMFTGCKATGVTGPTT